MRLHAGCHHAKTEGPRAESATGPGHKVSNTGWSVWWRPEGRSRFQLRDFEMLTLTSTCEFKRASPVARDGSTTAGPPYRTQEGKSPVTWTLPMFLLLSAGAAASHAVLTPRAQDDGSSSADGLEGSIFLAPYSGHDCFSCFLGISVPAVGI